MTGLLSARFTRSFRASRLEFHLDLPLHDAGVTVLFGPSGAGKTSALRVLAGLDREGAGTIRAGSDTWLDSAAGTCLPPPRRGVGMIFQEGALFPHLDVEGNVGFALPRAGRRAEVARLLALVGLADRGRSAPRELSGGERQRVALARALAARPRLLLLDEPLSSLDAPSREELRGSLRRLLHAMGIPSLLVTHDRLEALAIGDRIAVLAGGRVRQVGEVSEVFGRPADEEVARAVGVETVLPGRIVGRDRGVALVDVAGTRLAAMDPGGGGDDVLCCIRAEEVLIERGAPAEGGEGSRSSARNRLPGRVVSVTREGPLVRLSLDCGLPLSARVTRLSFDEMGIEPGDAVVAFFKAPSVHLVSRERVAGT